MVLWFYQLWYNDMCFIVERQIHKETNSPISTLQKKMNHVGWSHSFPEQVLHQRLVLPSVKNLKDSQPWIALDRHIQIIAARERLPNGPQEIRWAM